MVKTYDIKRGDTLIATVKAKGQVSERIMGDSSVSMAFELPESIKFYIGDTVRVDGVEYVLNSDPTVIKHSKVRYKYQLTFQGYKFELAKASMLFLGSDNTLKEIDFPLMGNAVTFIDLIVANLNREGSGWVRGVVDSTEFVNKTFAEQNCLEALATIAVDFETEYWIVGKTIHLTKRGSISSLMLEHGREKGLYTLGRSQPSDKNVYTRIIPRGGTKNIPGSYRSGSTRLQLPGTAWHIERNTNKYGVIERARTYDEIYPRREGTVTAVGDQFTFTDNAIDFDVNAQQIPGSTSKGKIVFNTGQLAGYEFDISNYDHATKTFVIAINQNEKAVTVPSALIKAAVGDKYVITGIVMPDSYIVAAEAELYAKALADLTDNSDPWVTYNLLPDPLHFKRKSIVLTLGDYIRLKDDDLGIDSDIRVVSYKKDLQDYFKYTDIELATVVAISSFVREYANQQKAQRLIAYNRLTDVNLVRRNYLTTQELKNMVFDADGYFTDKIKPLSIETTMLSVGAKSQQFVLKGVVFSPNYLGDQAKIRATAGTLDHFSLTDTIRSWNIAAYTNDGLVSGTAYYIYAKCDKSGSDGTLLLSNAQITVDEDASFYHFIVGVLHTAIDGVRGISLTYGQTTINGKFITTGVITSTDGLTYFNLDGGTIGGRIVFGAGSSGYANLTDKPNLGVYALSSALSSYVLGSSLGSLAFDSVVEAAKLGTTIIDGGYIKASLLNVSAIIVAGGIETTSGAQTKANAAQSAAQLAASGYVSGLASTLGTLAYNSAVSAAMLDSTIIVGGYIKTTLLDVSAIIVNGSLSTTSDAQTRANSAQSAAQVYAAAQAAAAQAAAISSSSADATAKAAAAQSAAQSYAASATSALASSLGSLAYQSLVQDSMLGSTIIVGGYIKTSLLDVDFIKGLNFNFVMGTIGGFTITSNTIVSNQYYGKLEIGSGTTPYIKMVKYAYLPPDDIQVQFGGAEMSPDGFKMGNNSGVSGTFLDGSGNTITVQGGIITGLS